MKLMTTLWLAGSLLLALPAHAAGGSDTPSTPAPAWGASSADDPAVKSAKAAMATGDYATAQGQLKAALAANPGSADLNNLYAYSLRKGANPDLPTVFKHYGEALRIDPKHLNANEYIGEAYLMADNLPKAKEHLAVLDRLCLFGCEQYTELKKAIAAYEAKKK